MFLIIDKRQRVSVPTMGEYPTAVTRIMEELKKKGIEYHFAYNDELEFEFTNGQTVIKANGKDVLDFSHIIFRGHYLHNSREYEYKRMIIDHVEKQNKKIKVLNSEAIKIFPFYNKIYLALILSQHNIPYFDTYFRTDGKYLEKREALNEYPLIIKEYAGINRLQEIDGVMKVKKNVYKLDNEKCFDQEYLRDQDLSKFFVQEFSPTAKDMRIFVKNGKVIAGWTRKATDNFMTVSKGEYKMYNKPDKEIKKIAEKVAKIFKADFIAVDFMFLDNKPYIQEISLHPGFKAYETKIDGDPVNIAKAIVESII